MKKLSERLEEDMCNPARRMIAPGDIEGVRELEERLAFTEQKCGKQDRMIMDYITRMYAAERKLVALREVREKVWESDALELDAIDAILY